MLDSDMSCLDKVMRTVRQKEAVHEQNRQLKRGTQEDPIVVDHVSGGSKPQKPPGPRVHKKEEARNRTKSPQNHGLCKQSGKDHAPQRGAQPWEQPVLNATGKVTFRLSQW